MGGWGSDDTAPGTVAVLGPCTSQPALCGWLPGVHLVEVLYDEVAVPKSPFRVAVTEGCDPTRVRAFGPGLEGGLVNKANHFTVETR